MSAISEGYQVSITDSFTLIYCYKCRCPFAVPENIRRRWQEDGTSFYCPNGHSQLYIDSDVQKLQKELARAKKEKEWAEQESRNKSEALMHSENARRSQKAATTRLKNRIKHGVCPCCKRTFANIASHMKTKHPAFVKDSANV